MSPEEYMNRMRMKQNMPQQQPIVNVASPEAVTKESFLASAPNYSRDLSFIQQPKPEPNALQQAGSYVAESALGKAADAGWDRGSQMFADKVVAPVKTWWNSLAMPKTAGGAAANVVGNPGVMSKLGAAAGGAGSGLAAMAGPIGIGLLGAKMLGLFNRGGAVGPLSPQYHERGGYQEDKMSHRSKNMRVPYPGFMDFARMTGRNIWGSDEIPMWEKVMMTGAIPVDYGMSKLKHAIHNKDYGLTRNAINYDDPMVLNPGEVHQSMILGPLSDINYRNQGGKATSKPQSTKIEKKETIEYKS